MAYVKHNRMKMQQGMALVISLVLLLVMTLIGVSIVRTTGMEEKMAANVYDRSLSFQASEAGLRVAENLSPMVHNVDCQIVGTPCPTVPAANAAWVTVPSATYNPGSLNAGQPQYFIQRIGQFSDPDSATGFNQSSNAMQYGAQGLNTTATYYRISARSHNPATAAGRAAVILQTMIKQ